MITFYGTATCVDCLRSKQFLAKNNIDYEYIGLEEHPEHIETVENYNNGMRIIPTIVFEDGSILAEPSDKDLAEKLGITE